MLAKFAWILFNRETDTEKKDSLLTNSNGAREENDKKLEAIVHRWKKSPIPFLFFDLK